LDLVTLSALMDSLTAEGLTGLEAIYFPQFDSSRSFVLLAEAKSCFVTVGSDSHSARSMLLPSYHRFVNSAADVTNSTLGPDKMYR